jgi:hypothetical protein
MGASKKTWSDKDGRDGEKKRGILHSFEVIIWLMCRGRVVHGAMVMSMERKKVMEKQRRSK